MVPARIGAIFLATALLVATAPAHSAATLTDPQIAHIAYTAGDIDIKAAKLALAKSKNPDVIAFANNMVADHTAVNDKALALVKKLNVTPEDNDTSKTLVTQAAAEQDKLSKLSGATFDKAYAANELAYHKTVNGALKNTLIPNAHNSELKDLLATGLKIFEGHQEHAQMLVDELK
jgi:putative membrane protein